LLKDSKNLSTRSTSSIQNAHSAGKSTLEDFPELRPKADKPLKQVNIDSFSPSVVSIEGYFHAVVIVVCHSGYRWLYCMKTKDDMLKVIKNGTEILPILVRNMIWLWQ
jgi:hypothetical protein